MTVPERSCIKCGRAVAADESICEVCNRAGMQTPSATQYHGTIVVAIVAGVTALALAATLTVRGVGPFRGSAIGFTSTAPSGLEVRIEVLNDGTRTGRATCRIVAQDASGRRLASRIAESPPVDGGQRATFVERLADVNAEPAEVTATCR